MPKYCEFVRPDSVDPLCLEKARQNALLDLRCAIEANACQYAVPVDMLTDFVSDWLMSEQAKIAPIQANEFVREYGRT